MTVTTDVPFSVGAAAANATALMKQIALMLLMAKLRETVQNSGGGAARQAAVKDVMLRRYFA